MYVPLALIAVSLIGIAVLVYRKMPYLRKLTPEAHEFGPSLAHDLWPEMYAAIERIHFEAYVAMLLRELEKLMRKIRIFFSRIDRASSELISELRTAHVRTTQQAGEEPLPAVEAIPEHDTHVEVRTRKLEPDAAALKAEEQHLIIEIAQNPKNPALYSRLGDIYMALNNFHDAKDAFEAAIDLDKQDESLKQRLSSAERKLHEREVGF